jgi:anthranilate synthase component 2
MGATVLLVDNYDSFVYNLVQQLGELGANPVVRRNDAVDVAGIRALACDLLVISPGPGRPDDAGVSLAAVTELAGELPILGVCLGHQAIGQAFGARIVRAPVLMHGKTSEVRHDGRGVFSGLPQPMTATRYHSLVVDPGSVPDELEVTATTDDGVIMGLRHRELPVEGVQFHPESILTASGPSLLANFLAEAAARA